MSLNNSLVSIVISTFNNGSTINACLKSIKSQTYKNIEVIIVDEWSKDNTCDVAKTYSAKIFLHGKERANNRNYGIEKAKGNYYFIIDSDMKLGKNVVKESVDACSKKRFDAVVVFTIRFFGSMMNEVVTFTDIIAFGRLFIFKPCGDSAKQLISCLTIKPLFNDRIGHLYHPFRFERSLPVIHGRAAVAGGIEVHAVDRRFNSLHRHFPQAKLRSGS